MLADSNMYTSLEYLHISRNIHTHKWKLLHIYYSPRSSTPTSSYKGIVRYSEIKTDETTTRSRAIQLITSSSYVPPPRVENLARLGLPFAKLAKPTFVARDLCRPTMHLRPPSRVSQWPPRRSAEDWFSSCARQKGRKKIRLWY